MKRNIQEKGRKERERDGMPGAKATNSWLAGFS